MNADVAVENKRLVHLKRFTDLLLGEEDLHVEIDSSVLDKTSTFQDGRFGSGFKIDRDRSTVTVRRVSRLAVLAGLRPLYYFKGTLQADKNTMKLIGRILMVRPSKVFILTWIAAVFAALLLGIGMTIFSAVQFMTAPTDVIENQLMKAGLLVGGTTVIALFGLAVFAITKLVARSQKKRLRRFCENLNGDRQRGQI